MDRITASFAAIPSRIDNARRVYEDLSMQADEVRVHTNGFTVPFNYSGPEDLGDAGKFAHGPQEGYWIVCDDDLFYPPDYVEQLIAKIEEYGREAVITLHGKRFDRTPVDRFCRGFTANYRCLDRVAEDVPVHVPGTGVLGFHVDTIRPTLGDFPLRMKNMADLHFGRLCQAKGVPIICAAHEKDWITHQWVPGSTLWRESLKDDALQTELVNSVEWT